MIERFLIFFDEDGELVRDGSLAEAWESSGDGLTWTFHLVQGVTLSSGREFNAEVVEERLSPSCSLMISRCISATAIDDYTLQILVESPIDMVYYVSNKKSPCPCLGFGTLR